MFAFMGGLNGDDYCPSYEDDRYIPGEDGEYSATTRRPTKCNTCGSTYVYWTNVDGRWILFDKNVDMNTRKDACHKCHRKRFDRLRRGENDR
jgi:hypothetical protein